MNFKQPRLSNFVYTLKSKIFLKLKVKLKLNQKALTLTQAVTLLKKKFILKCNNIQFINFVQTRPSNSFRIKVMLFLYLSLVSFYLYSRSYVCLI